MQTHEGRPTQVSGNPNHPASLGSSDAFTIASMLHLYDPDRSTQVRNQGEISTWEDFEGALAGLLNADAALRILTETVTSPTLASQLNALLEAFPTARWHQYEPIAPDSATAGAQLAFGEPVNTVYRFENADVVLSLDADFLTGEALQRYFLEEREAHRKLLAAMGELSG